ncbi:hypothetical protein MXH76_004447, partial [Salmonella enterica]|nr:hypothetical protein [Salmonella enterica]
MERFLYSKYYLYPGRVLDKHFNLLVEFSGIRSEKVIKALGEHFVYGHPRTEVCKKHSVTQGYLSVKIKKLQQLSKVIYEMKM